MLAVRFSPLRDLQDRMDQMSNRFAQHAGNGHGSERPSIDPTGFPALNAWEDAECYYVEAELPGLALEDLEIYLSDENTLTIKGHRKEPTLATGQWHRRERAFGSFERQLRLPGNVNADEVEACLKHGILTVTMPKTPETKPRKIAVNAPAANDQAITRRRKAQKTKESPETKETQE
jgi:HSP20 family protein